MFSDGYDYMDTRRKLSKIEGYTKFRVTPDAWASNLFLENQNSCQYDQRFWRVEGNPWKLQINNRTSRQKHQRGYTDSWLLYCLLRAILWFPLQLWNCCQLGWYVDVLTSTTNSHPHSDRPKHVKQEECLASLFNWLPCDWLRLTAQSYEDVNDLGGDLGNFIDYP